MSKKFFFLFSFFFLLFSFFIFAGGCLDKSCSGASNCNCERYRVDPGETITVYEHNLCQRVTNQSGYPQTFIPAKTQTEWNLFCTYKPGHITCSNCPLPTPTPTPTPTPPPSCTNDCSYSGQTEYRCSGDYVQKRTCGNYDSDSCLEWSSWSNYENCNSYDGCSGGYYYNYYCSGGYCTYSSSCTETCCDQYYGNSSAYCSGGYCYPPPSAPTPTPTRTPTPTPGGGNTREYLNCGYDMSCTRVCRNLYSCTGCSYVKDQYGRQGYYNYYSNGYCYTGGTGATCGTVMWYRANCAPCGGFPGCCVESTYCVCTGCP